MESREAFSHYKRERTSLGLIQSPKQIFLSEAEAIGAAETLARRFGLSFTHYVCGTCGHYHVGKVRQ